MTSDKMRAHIPAHNVKAQEEQLDKAVPKGPSIVEFMLQAYGTPEALMSTASMVLGLLPQTRAVTMVFKAMGTAVAAQGIYTRYKMWREKTEQIQGGSYGSRREQIANVLTEGLNVRHWDNFNPGTRIVTDALLERLQAQNKPLPHGFRNQGVYVFNEKDLLSKVAEAPDSGPVYILIDNGTPHRRIMIEIDRVKAFYGESFNTMVGAAYHTYNRDDECVEVLDNLSGALAEEALESLRLDENVIHFEEGALGVTPRALASGNTYPEIDRHYLANIINTSLANGKRHGIVLGGPPGTGKSSLIKDMESLVTRPIVYLPGDYFSSSYKLNQAIKVIKKVSPCVVVIEEFDRVASEVMDSEGISMSGVLGMLDGVHTGSKNVLLTTMNHLDKVDRAIVRPGRFDTILRVGYVRKKGDAEQILNKHLSDTSELIYEGGSYLSILQWWKLRRHKISAADLCNIIDTALLEGSYKEITKAGVKAGIKKLLDSRAIKAIDSDKD